MRLNRIAEVRISDSDPKLTPNETSRVLDTVPDILTADDWDPELDDTEPMLDLPALLDPPRAVDEFSEAPTLPGVAPRRRPSV